jgi:type I restriction enzyme S subunit
MWVGGGTPSKAVADYWRGEIPWVSAKDMKVERITDTIDHISERAVDESSTRLVPAGSVLVVTRSGILGHTLPVAVADRDVAINQDLKALAPASGVDGPYVAWALRANAERILAGCSKSGTTVANVNTQMLLDFEIPFAPLAEQRRIVAVIEEQLSRLDAASELLRRAQGVCAALEASAHSAAFDRSWSARPLSELGDIVTGSTPRTKEPAFWMGDTPFITPGDICHGRPIEVAGRTLSDEGRSHARLLPSGTVLVTCIGATIGKTGLGLVESATNQQINALVPREDRLMPEFALSALSSPAGQRLITENASSTTLPILNKSRFSALQLPTPSLEEQGEVVATIERQLSLIDALRDAIMGAQKRSATLQRAILDRAFCGELVPQGPDDEPASLLLERIRAERAVGPKSSRRKRVRA